MNILVINGPNLNMLGIREPDIYGRETYSSLVEKIESYAKEKGVYVKMARGEMVRFMAENNIEDIEAIKMFNRLNFVYNEALSTENKYVFIREGK